MEQKICRIIKVYEEKKHELDQFLAGILVFFQKHPRLTCPPLPVIHSVKSRFKDASHLKDKIRRKLECGIEVSEQNLFDEVTDLIGVRVLHLHHEQFFLIHDEIETKISAGDWVMKECPVAYTWDPEVKLSFEIKNIKTEVRDTYYTSVHYTVRPNHANPICCEIQVRTLFEEIWGEVDHAINYPAKTEIIACKEQLRVLSKLVSTGTRLVDSIFKSYADLSDSHPSEE